MYYYKKYKKIFFLIGLFICYASSSFADVPGYVQRSSALTHSLEEEMRRKFGDAVVQNLYDYRLEIERGAYETTMNLCGAYRIARGMDLPAYHQKSGGSPYMKHESSEVRAWALKMNNEYGETLSSSLQSWLYIMYEGGVQPFSAIGGVKADLIDRSNISFFELRNWFFSFYTLYLVNSMGFLQAALHCLQTVDADQINQFALTVLAVDVTMSMVSYGVLFWTGEKIIGAIIKAVRWSARPLGRMIVKFLHNRNISSSTIKKSALVAGVLGLGWFGFWTADVIMESREQEKMLQKAMQEEIERAKKNKNMP